MESFSPLPDVDVLSSLQFKPLSAVDTIFSIPMLENKPQNISVRRHDPRPAPTSPPNGIAPEIRIVQDISTRGIEKWDEALARLNVHESQTSRLLSWDSLRPTHPTCSGAELSPFLTEQASTIFDAAQNQAGITSMKERAVEELQLRESLLLNLVGSSSRLYTWDKASETFHLLSTSQSTEESIRVNGYTRKTSANLVRRFVNIGTLLRRLETLVATLTLNANPPATRAFTHSLSTILERMRASLFAPPIILSANLTALWLAHEEVEEDLDALACLCFRETSKSPPFIDPPYTDTASFLSHLYFHVYLHFTRSSPPRTRALLAFIFTSASAHIPLNFGASIGLLALNTTLSDADKDKEKSDSDDVDGENSQNVPTFVSDEIAQRLHRARRSLKLLKEARPDHPLCEPNPSWQSLCDGLVWTEPGVQTVIDGLETHMLKLKTQIAAWRSGVRFLQSQASDKRRQDEALDDRAPNEIDPASLTFPTTSGSVPYKQELDGFRMFDLEPGVLVDLKRHQAIKSSQVRKNADLDAFLNQFPASLPSDTPTIEHLIHTTILAPLTSHASILSSSLLDLFLTDLRWLNHLALLRRFILFGDAGFVSRLRMALFSDAVETEGKQRAQSKRRGSGILGRVTSEDGVGLGLGLSERDAGTWPPGGSELSFLLRRVIIDSLQTGHEEHHSDKKSPERVIVEEAAWRVGFALSELAEEDEDGQAKWLDPMSIEALDFLYMLYNPPPTIAVLITPEILHKYRRIFTFLLQLLRVETVTRTLFHSALKRDHPLFDNTLSSRSLFYRFRFQVQQFVSTLITYVFDTAIGSNWASFISRLSKLQQHGADHSGEELQDVFSILDYHSAVLDSILEACLLKARHKSAGTVMKDCLETILLLGKLARDTASSTLTYTEASATLLDLYARFEKSMGLLIKSLEKLDGRSQARRLWMSAIRTTKDGSAPNPLESLRDHDLETLTKDDKGRSQGLGDLLLRLDINDWYRNKK